MISRTPILRLTRQRVNTRCHQHHHHHNHHRVGSRLALAGNQSSPIPPSFDPLLVITYMLALAGAKSKSRDQTRTHSILQVILGPVPGVGDEMLPVVSFSSWRNTFLCERQNLRMQQKLYRTKRIAGTMGGAMGLFFCS